MSTTVVTRIFRYKSAELEDPDENLTPRQVMDHFSSVFPELNNAQVKPLGLEGNQDIYEFTTATGHFG